MESWNQFAQWWGRVLPPTDNPDGCVLPCPVQPIGPHTPQTAMGSCLVRHRQTHVVLILQTLQPTLLMHDKTHLSLLQQSQYITDWVKDHQFLPLSTYSHNDCTTWAFNFYFTLDSCTVNCLHAHWLYAHWLYPLFISLVSLLLRFDVTFCPISI